MEKKQYAIRCRENGDVIDTFATLAEAQDTMLEYYRRDHEEGIYVGDFYEIAVWKDGDYCKK